MKVVHKFILDKRGKDQSVEMPSGAHILRIGIMPKYKGDFFAQRDICIWALVDTDQPMEKRNIFCVGTGHQCEEFDLIKDIVPYPAFGLSSKIHYLGSVILEEVCEIWHYFEKTDIPVQK